MEESSNDPIDVEPATGEPGDTVQIVPETSTSETTDVSQNLFPESPVYEPEEDPTITEETPEVEANNEDQNSNKRKLSEEISYSIAKVQRLDVEDMLVSTQTLDDEVSEITNITICEAEEDLPSTSCGRRPVRSSPKKVIKRRNSSDNTPKTPYTPKSRSVSVDITKSRTENQLEHRDEKEAQPISPHSPCMEFIPIEATPAGIPESIAEENTPDTLNDSQNFHLALSPFHDDSIDDTSKLSNGDPIIPRDQLNNDILDAGRDLEPKSDPHNNSDLKDKLQQPLAKDYNKGKTTDQESTDSICSGLDSPEHVPTLTSKLISKLSNGNSSTPTEIIPGDDDNTPDMAKMNGNKGKRGKHESFRVSNTTTPSTISPLQNGHSMPLNTPQIPVFDVHVSHNEDCDFLSLYVVRTDNDIGVDMGKEYQRISKRFTIDPYMADVSVNNSPSSVTSVGMVNLPNRSSFVSTVSSTSSSSTRTSDGAFVVPQPPRKSVVNPTSTVKGYDALMKKLQDLFSHIRDSSITEANRSMTEDKRSIGIQASLSGESVFSNGTASPEEINKCDKATPKSSLKKRVRGRRPIAGKTKRALLPTQPEEVEYMHGMNSPEMVPTNGDSGKISPVKSPKEEKPLSSLVGTPKSVTKLKQKRRPTSPRPATPVEKAVVKTEYPGYPPETVVLAKWVDKRYYSGKVLEITEPNKYLIKFDDGQSKTLLDDFIIFGDMKKLPLQGQSVYAMVDEEQNYEPGLVLEIDENDSGTVAYRCTTDGDTIVMVTASELYLTEDQARSLKESSRSRSPTSPATPRRRHNRELDLDNIIQGPRSARTRDKGNASAKKRVTSPKSPKASTSGVKTKAAQVGRKRLASESSEVSESSNSAPPARLEEVAGVEPEVQKTPRKIDGVKAGPLQLKGAAKQNIGKKNSKLTKFENDEDTVLTLGPIPTAESKLFTGLCFLLTCTESPKSEKKDEKEEEKKEEKKEQETPLYSSGDDSESTMAGTDTEDLEFCPRPYNKERLKEQLEAGGGTVYSNFDDVPKNKYSVCKLIAPRPCLTAKYLLCLASDIRALSHAWVIMSCIQNSQLDMDAYYLPAGLSIMKKRYINWDPATGRRNTSFFKDKIILLCGDYQFVKFWERVCSIAGATTRVVNEEDPNMSGALVLVTEWDCPHEVQNKANQDNIPLVSTTWVHHCLIEASVVPYNGHDKFSFMYAEAE